MNLRGPTDRSLEPVTLPRVEATRRMYEFFAPIVHGYFRSETVGMERIPPGQVLIITHHDGGVLPFNAVCFGVAWYERFGFDRPLFCLTHDLFHQFSARGARNLAAMGLVRADRPVMNGALKTGASVLLLPGAARETFRPYWQRREIDLGKRAGFVAQALRWNIPIVPVVSAGAHETLFVLARGTKWAHRLRIPHLVRSGDVLPLLVGVPWGAWVLPILPQFPLPSKIETEVLDPIFPDELAGHPVTPSDADDPDVQQRGFELVLGRMRPAVAKLYDRRRLPVIG